MAKVYLYITRFVFIPSGINIFNPIGVKERFTNTCFSRARWTNNKSDLPLLRKVNFIFEPEHVTTLRIK